MKKNKTKIKKQKNNVVLKALPSFSTLFQLNYTF